MMERRGGFRLNPIAALREGLDRLASRRIASGLRGVYVRPDGVVDDWIEVGSGGGAPSFDNSWVNYGGAWATAAFRKDGEGTVHIKGFIKSGTMRNNAFTLPVGYRPAADIQVPATSDAVFATLVVFGTGGLRPDVGSNTYFSINASFVAEQ